MRWLVVLGALAGCDLVFSPATLGDAPPADELAVSLAVADPVTSDGPELSPTDVTLTVTNPSERTVYYKVQSASGAFVRTHTNVINGELTDAAVEAWVPPYAPTKVRLAVTASYDPFLADPVTAARDITVRQRVGNPVAGTSMTMQNGDAIFGIGFSVPASAQIVELGAHVAAAGVSLELAVYQNSDAGAKELIVATPPVSSIDPAQPVVVPIAPRIIAANRPAWIAIMGAASYPLRTATSSQQIVFAGNAFASGFPSILVANSGVGAAGNLFATLAPE